jgi:hypothetical protein
MTQPTQPQRPTFQLVDQRGPMQTGSQPGAGPSLGQPGGRYLGRIVVEVWEPADASDDGLVYSVTLAGGSPADSNRLKSFVTDVARRLSRRVGLIN